MCNINIWIVLPALLQNIIFSTFLMEEGIRKGKCLGPTEVITQPWVEGAPNLNWFFY